MALKGIPAVRMGEAWLELHEGALQAEDRDNGLLLFWRDEMPRFPAVGNILEARL